MTKAFESLETEKHEVILQAAFEEFAANGFSKASTNRIVKKAGIGKGMLFYYFGSKQELFIDLIDYSKKFIESYWGMLGKTAPPSDIVGSLQMATRIKMEAMITNPSLFDFLTRLFIDQDTTDIPEEGKAHFDSLNALRESSIGRMFQTPDTSMLRKDISAEKQIKYMHWIIDGYAQNVIAKVKAVSAEKLSDLDLDPYWDEFHEFMDDLKRLFYVT